MTTNKNKGIEEIVEEFDKKFPAHSYRENQFLRPELKDFIRQVLISYTSLLIEELEKRKWKGNPEMETNQDFNKNQTLTLAQDIIRKSINNK